MILAVLQARMGSERLPGRPSMPLARAPLVVRQIERMARARRVDRIVVSTTTDPADDALEAVVRREAIAVHRGPPQDELARLAGALEAHPADHVVRIGDDSPLVDPDLIDATIDLHLSEQADHTTNRSPGAAFPAGQGVEVITADGLRRLAADSAALRLRAGDARETPPPVRWSSLALLAQPDQGEVRWAVEGPADYAFVAAVYDVLYPANRAFTSADVRRLLEQRPDLASFGGVRRL
ncbi:cytidylyltransferase domain-containing protein [Caulobacter rhizosphaerae]|uniref:cytidylyltransferase domain-containing protein n=1 Tax=Caulobacter rhizosphaerae TaxID=2010972 RepID=UPI0013D49B8E|nr:NTP transferase domain-containing protein [Caulobacter rhizosphaerae]GGL32661.1 flagellin modification protein FlmC [Caulobacter rhizosphaerae]